MASRKKKASSSSNIGCLILLAGIIILAVIFAVKFPDIKATLERTNFVDLIQKRATTTTTIPAPAPVTTIPVTTLPATTLPVTPLPPTTTSPQASSSTNSSALPIQSAPPANAPAVQVRQASLFFVRIEDDGVISRREVKRSIAASDSPLTDAINALIAGPSEGEIRSGLVSLIPRGTRLLGITVRGSTAIIDLSDAFMYNHYGIEGYSAQLKQIVYTATSFASVQDVQLLVEGKEKDYLGGEGVYIGKPLSRNSF